MFAVNFYTFNKKENSTARPSSTPVTFDCNILRGSGIINPSIELDIGLTTNPSQWNYCYIPNFGRYYFVTEWYYNEALWTATLKVDVLATYKSSIGSTSLYMLRASNEYDGRIIDTLYPTKVNCDYDSNTVNNPWTTISNGCFVIGAVSKTPYYGSVNYYVMSPSAMQGVIQGLLDDTVTETNGFNLDNADEGFQLALINPLQYIKSAVFIPLPYSSVAGVPSPVNRVTIFNWTVATGGSYKIIVGDPTTIITRTFTLSKHPQTESRGNYVNVAPYTKITLLFPPFGVIELDTTVLCDESSITTEVRIDNITGRGILEVQANGIVLNRLESQIGVPIQLSQVTRDYMGAINNTMGAIQNVAGAVGSALMGNVAGAVSGAVGAVSGIANAANSLIPRSQSIGSGGSYSQLYETPRLDFQFFECVDDDITANGRPLCKKRTPASLGGYMLVQDGDVPNTGTQEESRSIKTYLETGFYYE